MYRSLGKSVEHPQIKQTNHQVGYISSAVGEAFPVGLI